MMLYCLTSPSAGSQRTLRELVVGSITWRFFTPPRGSERDGTHHSPKQLLHIIRAVCFLLQGWVHLIRTVQMSQSRGDCQSQRSLFLSCDGLNFVLFYEAKTSLLKSILARVHLQLSVFLVFKGSYFYFLTY